MVLLSLMIKKTYYFHVFFFIFHYSSFSCIHEPVFAGVVSGRTSASTCWSTRTPNTPARCAARTSDTRKTRSSTWSGTHPSHHLGHYSVQADRWPFFSLFSLRLILFFTYWCFSAGLEIECMFLVAWPYQENDRDPTVIFSLSYLLFRLKAFFSPTFTLI